MNDTLRDEVARLRRGDLCAELHPTNTGDHAIADLAREIVGHFHSKADLVQAMTVLLTLIDREREAAYRAGQERLKTPTDEMIQAGFSASGFGWQGTKTLYPPVNTMRAIWRAMYAAAIEALPVGERVMDWQPFETAPKDGTAIQAEIPGHGADNVIAWQADALLDSNGQSCGGWAFVTDREPPDCWTDGVCWEVNEYGAPSVQPTRWKALPVDAPQGIAADYTPRGVATPSTDGGERVS